MMHPLVRDLYKRVLHVGRDYPTGLAHVKTVWKRALRNPDNCPSCYPAKEPTPTLASSSSSSNEKDAAMAAAACQEEILRAVHRGRFMVKEMIGVIQIKKYRAMKRRYGTTPVPQPEQQQQQQQQQEDPVVQKAIEHLQKLKHDKNHHP